MDIFDAKIFCKKCNIEMKKTILNRDGFQLRAVECPICKDKIIHPTDLSIYNHFNDLKRKTFSVKLRVVGNSHAISIPKEIVDFINEINQNLNKEKNRIEDMVQLCFEDFRKLRLIFGGQNER